MPVYSNVAGVWQRIKRPEVNVTGTWTELEQAYVRVAGEYRTLLGWDVTTASFSHQLDVSAQEFTVLGVSFKTDGTKMYIVGISSDRVFQYSLTTPWDLSTASYDSVSFSVNAQDSNPQDVTFRTDGTRMYVVGQADAIHQYALSSPWDVSTASFTKSLAVTDPRSVAFKPDGSRLYHPIFSGGVAEYSLSTAWDVGSASFVGTFTFNTAMDGIAFKPDGRRVYVSKEAQRRIYQYDLPTAWDLSTATSAGTYDVPAPNDDPRGLAFSEAGDRLYVTDRTTDDVFEYLL